MAARREGREEVKPGRLGDMWKGDLTVYIDKRDKRESVYIQRAEWAQG